MRAFILCFLLSIPMAAAAGKTILKKFGSFSLLHDKGEMEVDTWTATVWLKTPKENREILTYTAVDSYTPYPVFLDKGGVPVFQAEAGFFNVKVNGKTVEISAEMKNKKCGDSEYPMLEYRFDEKKKEFLPTPVVCKKKPS